MAESSSSDLDVERIMYEIREAVARQHGGAQANGSATAALFGANNAAENGDSFRLQPPFQPKLDNHYHVNDLLRFHGAEFIRNAYLALLSREPDNVGMAQHLEGLASGRFNKLDILASLHSSPEGRRNNVRLDGLSLRVAIRRLGRVPVVGYIVRLMTGVARLPVLVQHQNRFELYLWSQLQRVVDYQNQSKQETTAALAQISAQILEGMQRATEQQQTVESALRRLEALSAQQTQLGDALGTHMIEIREDLRQSTSKLTEQIALQNTQVVQQQQAFSQQQATEKQELLNKQQELSSRIQQLIERQLAVHDELRTHERRLAVLLEGVRHTGGESSFTRLAAQEEDHLLDRLYASFEDRFRGEREEVEHRLEVYVPILAEAQVTNGVLDLGCGRGEWLRLLRSKGIEARGVDRNRVFIEECRDEDLEVVEADALDHLRSLPPESLNAISAFHLVEHLPFEILIKLLDETQRTLKRGGLVMLETPNPENFMVGSCCFYTDPTHRNPIPSQTLEFLLESRGFDEIKVLKLRPWEAAKLEGETELIKRFNEFFYSAPDYGIIATKP